MMPDGTPMPPAKRAAYLRRWREQGTVAVSDEELAQIEQGGTEPSLVRKAAHFGRAALRHAADRGRQVDEATYKKRLAICRKCPMCDRRRMVCREKRCGCRLKVKARWSSEDCPLGKWPPVGTNDSTDDPGEAKAERKSNAN